MISFWITFVDHATKMVVYHSNNYRFLKASFHGTCVKVEKCGIDLGLNHNTKLRDHLEYFGDNGSAGETAIHNVKGRSENHASTTHSLFLDNLPFYSWHWMGKSYKELVNFVSYFSFLKFLFLFRFSLFNMLYQK